MYGAHVISGTPLMDKLKTERSISLNMDIDVPTQLKKIEDTFTKQKNHCTDWFRKFTGEISSVKHELEDMRETSTTKHNEFIGMYMVDFASVKGEITKLKNSESNEDYETKVQREVRLLNNELKIVEFEKKILLLETRQHEDGMHLSYRINHAENITKQTIDASADQSVHLNNLVTEFKDDVLENYHQVTHEMKNVVKVMEKNGTDLDMLVAKRKKEKVKMNEFRNEIDELKKNNSSYITTDVNPHIKTKNNEILEAKVKRTEKLMDECRNGLDVIHKSAANESKVVNKRIRELENEKNNNQVLILHDLQVNNRNIYKFQKQLDDMQIEKNEMKNQITELTRNLKQSDTLVFSLFETLELYKKTHDNDMQALKRCKKE